MRILIICIAIFTTVKTFSQEELKLQYVDSLTYQYYLSGDWDQMLDVGKTALREGIEFKYLYQRMGYAYFLRKDYYKSIKYYSKALKYDATDEISNLYLYYANLYSGNYTFARYYAEKLPSSQRKNLKETKWRLADAVDIEYNYKWHKEVNRTNPHYGRIGLNSQLGYRINFYQSISTFRQSASYSDAYNDHRFDYNQKDYYASINWTTNKSLGFNVGYHIVKTVIDTALFDLILEEITESDKLNFKSNLYFGKVYYKINRLDLVFSTSTYVTEFNRTNQNGLQLGYAIPGSKNLYIKNSIYQLQDNYFRWYVTSHSLGMLFFNRLWAEANITNGNLTNFNDFNGLYIHNSFDPTTFKSSISLYWYHNRNLTLFCNLSRENKQNIYLQSDYKQNSISGGIIWKL